MREPHSTQLQMSCLAAHQNLVYTVTGAAEAWQMRLAPLPTEQAANDVLTSGGAGESGQCVSQSQGPAPVGGCRSGATS